MKKDRIFDVAIIGAGPAGLTAGLYGARAGLDCAIIEKAAVGGLATLTYEIENYPGVKSTDGFSLCYTMMEQCKQAGTTFIFDRVLSVDSPAIDNLTDNSKNNTAEKQHTDNADRLKNSTADIKTLSLASGEKLRAKKIIITAGASPRKLAVSGEEKYTGKGVSYCATCDGAFFKGKDVAVIGGGNTAAEDALYLEKLARKVYLIHRRDSLRADKVLADRLLSSAVIPIWNTTVTELHGEDKISQLTLKNIKSDSLSTLSVDGVFVAVGQTPNSELFENIKTDDKGYIVTDEFMRTSVDGIFAAGDVRSKSLRQIVTACADGAIAADTVAKELL